MSEAAVPARVESARYNAPPLREAVCEFIFGDTSAWDLTVPGKIFSALKTRYGAEPATAPSSNRASESRIELRSATSTEFVRYGESTLSVYVGVGYGGWRAFRQQVLEALNSYLELARPERIVRVRLRYTNRTEFPQSINLDDFFIFGFDIPVLQTSAIFDFAVNVGCGLKSNENAVLTLAISSADAEASKVAIRFDLEVYERLDEPAEADFIMRHVDDSKKELSAAFEASITDRLREMYGRV